MCVARIPDSLLDMRAAISPHANNAEKESETRDARSDRLPELVAFHAFSHLFTVQSHAPIDVLIVFFLDLLITALLALLMLILTLR